MNFGYIFYMEIYVVYLTKYTGEKLPPYYIGSTSLSKAKSGKYFGSIKSKKWKNIFDLEIKNNISLFSIEILSYHNTRKEAIEEEVKQQKERDVVNSNLYFNEALATIDGCWGKILKGKDSPSYGLKRSDSTRKKMSDAKKGKTYEQIYGENAKTMKEKRSKQATKEKNPMYGKHRTGKEAPNYGKKHSDEAKKKMSQAHKGLPSGKKGKPLAENIKDKLRLLNTGKNHPRYKDIDISKLKELKKEGKSAKELSEMFSISISTVFLKLKLPDL